tara:strand:+ start:57 stop:350 length:294 start_codon:yes stop_codon:yes gene_type:complete
MCKYNLVDVESLSVIAEEYLNNREYWRHDYVKYNNFKKTIGVILKTNSEYTLRKVFVDLCERNIIVKKRNIKKSYLYHFKNKNECKKEYTKTTIIFH